MERARTISGSLPVAFRARVSSSPRARSTSESALVVCTAYSAVSAAAARGASKDVLRCVRSARSSVKRAPSSRTASLPRSDCVRTSSLTRRTARPPTRRAARPRARVERHEAEALEHLGHPIEGARQLERPRRCAACAIGEGVHRRALLGHGGRDAFARFGGVTRARDRALVREPEGALVGGARLGGRLLGFRGSPRSADQVSLGSIDRHGPTMGIPRAHPFPGLQPPQRPDQAPPCSAM